MLQFSLLNSLIVFGGGGVGATLRWVLSFLVSSASGRFWFGTLFVNLVGSVIFFLLAKFAGDLGRNYELLIKTGILGSLTTFSTFSFDVVTLFKQGLIREAFLVVFLNVFFGIVIGIWILR